MVTTEMNKKKKKCNGKTEESCKDIKRNRQLDLLFISLLFLIIFFTNLPLAETELITPDASGYLDMGRNLFSGKGAVTSYNIYQGWTGNYHPFLPYTQFVFAIFAGLIWSLFGLIKAVIGFNIFIFSINCVLLYKLLRLNTDCWTSFLISLLIGFSSNVVFTAIFPWTEQLYLFFLLGAIYVYSRYKESGFWVGVIFAISCFTRIAGLYNVFAFGFALIILKGFSRPAFKEYSKIAFGFLIVFLSFEAFCFFKYGFFYPEFLAAGKIWRRAEISSGAFYGGSIPILNVLPVDISADVMFANLKKHTIDFVKVFGNMKFVFILAPVYAVFNLLKRKNALLVILFFQGACTLIGLLLTHLRWPESEPTRLSLIPFIMLSVVGFLSLKGIINRFFSRTIEKRFPIVFIIVISFFLCFQIKNYIPFRNYYKNVYWQRFKPYREGRDEIYEWIKTNTAKDDLIASNFLADPFLHERPFVSLPPGQALNVKNMKDFLKIFKPKYILTDNVGLINFLIDIGFAEKKRNDILVLLGASRTEK